MEGDLRGCICHYVLYATTLHSQIKSGTHGATKRLLWRHSDLDREARNRTEENFSDRQDSAQTVVYKMHSGFSTPSSDSSQLVLCRNSLPLSAGKDHSEPSGFHHKNPGEEYPFPIHHTSKHLLQPETSWGTLAATRAGVFSLLQEGTQQSVWQE